jgi:hypothetical protein
MAKRLLDRQISLLHYLTSSNAIYGDRGGAHFDPILQDIDRGLLDVEARFSCEKRMEKIVAVFHRTFKLMGIAREPLTKEFVDACPPTDIDRLVNAGQFRDFLCTRTRRDPPLPAYLLDVARCELALATALIAAEDSHSDFRASAGGDACAGIRRRPAVILLRCGYDVRAIFEDVTDAGEPAKRDTCIAIAPPSASSPPQILDVSTPVFELLEALDDWTDPSAFLDETREAADLLAGLVAAHLVEICG